MKRSHLLSDARMSPTDAAAGSDTTRDADYDAFVRRVNLLEILAEDHPETAPPPEEAARTWTEACIRAHYCTNGASGGARGPSPSRGLGIRTTTDEETSPATGRRETETTPPARRRDRARSVRSRFPEPDDATFKRWFPGFERANAVANDGDELRGKGKKKVTARVLCWPNAGNAEDVFTSERARVDGALRTVPSPLLEWCRRRGAELFAVQLPGRAARTREPAFRCAREAAAALMAVIATRFFVPDTGNEEDRNEQEAKAEGAGLLVEASKGARDAVSAKGSDDDDDDDDAFVPWIVVGHSVGSWCAFEFARLARSLGFPPPALACLSGFPAPDIPREQRPWTANVHLDDAAFKDECRAWGVDEAVFAENAWRAFEPLLRADFALFDEYEHDDGVPKDSFGVAASSSERSKKEVFPRLLTLRGTKDERVTREAVSAWRRFAAAFDEKKNETETETETEREKKPRDGVACFSYRHVEIDGARHLLLNAAPAHKNAWLRAVVDALETVPS